MALAAGDSMSVVRVNSTRKPFSMSGRQGDQPPAVRATWQEPLRIGYRS